MKQTVPFYDIFFGVLGLAGLLVLASMFVLWAGRGLLTKMGVLAAMPKKPPLPPSGPPRLLVRRAGSITKTHASDTIV